MRAGALIHTVTIQRRQGPAIGDRDALGQASDNWVTVCTRAAEVLTLSGLELQRAAAAFAEVSVVITIRYREGLTAGMRVSWRGLAYDIGAVVDLDMRRIEMRLLCTAGASLQGG